MFPVSIRCLSEKTVSPQGRFPADEAEARELSLCARGHSVNDGKDWYTVFCFAEPEHAAKFMARFGGESSIRGSAGAEHVGHSGGGDGARSAPESGKRGKVPSGTKKQMAETSIEWTDATWNPVAGCTVITAGCTNCYAMRMAARLDAIGQEKYRGLLRGSGASSWVSERCGGCNKPRRQRSRSAATVRFPFLPSYIQALTRVAPRAPMHRPMSPEGPPYSVH